jgi:PAS domain S-box-containing protein
MPNPKNMPPRSTETWESESWFRDLLDAAPDGMVVVDRTGRIVLVNSQTESLFGYGREEILGQDVEILIPHRFRERHQVHRIAFFSDPRIRPMGANLELFGLRKDRTEFPVEVSLGVIKIPEGILVMSAIRDITERKLAEELRLRLAAIMESSEDAIASVTPDGIIANWNAGAERIFGYSQDEAVGKPVTILAPPERPDEENKILQTLKAGGRIDQFETIRVTKTGERLIVSLSIAPIKDSSGKVVCFSGISRNITERKQAEAALHASEERLRLAQQAARMGTFERDVATGLVTWSAELDSLYGLAPGTLNGTTTAFFVSLLHPDDRARIVGLVESALKTGQSTSGEWRVVWPDGSVHWIAGRWRVFMNESGEPARMIGVNADITERKLAEEALRESEQRLRLATEVGRMYAYDWDVTTNIVVRSSEHVKVLGLRDALDLPQQHFVDKIHPDDRPNFLAAIAALSPEKPTAEITYRSLATDGIQIWLKSNGRGFFDAKGRLVRVIGMVADITDAKRAEEALRISEERLRLAQWAAHIGTFDVNLRTGVDVWPPETEALYGLPPGGFGRTLSAFEDLIHPQDKERVINLTQEMIRTGQPTEGEWRVVWPDGSVHWIAGRGQVFMNDSGEPSRMLGVNMDITERKRTEDALAEMTRKLIESQEQERARIGRELHDDINQRLAMLGLELEQLQDASETSSRIQGLRQKLAEISNDVQALSHELNSSKLDYLGVTAGLKSWCREISARHKIEIDFYSDVAIVLPLDLGKPLFRVLQEALHNAIKYSGVRQFKVQVREHPAEVHLLISDSGKGFSLEEALQGPGLGLTSMRERVRLINGTITIASQPMGGTTVHVRVPLESERKTEMVG